MHLDVGTPRPTGGGGHGRLAGPVVASGGIAQPVAADGSAAAARSVYVTNSANVGGDANIARFTIRPDGD